MELLTTSIITLGFALAATTAMFSIVDTTLLRPSPFPEAERLVRGRSYPGLSREKLRQWRAEHDIFSAACGAHERTR